MSNILTDIVGCTCSIITKDDYMGQLEGEVLAVDDAWIKVRHTDRRGNPNLRILRIETITQIEVLRQPGKEPATV